MKLVLRKHVALFLLYDSQQWSSLLRRFSAQYNTLPDNTARVLLNFASNALKKENSGILV